MAHHIALDEHTRHTIDESAPAQASYIRVVCDECAGVVGMYQWVIEACSQLQHILTQVLQF